MDGIINILKHAGATSHDIVHQARKILKTKKVGHTGTLDPDAVGVLPICVGQATRLVDYLSASSKRYRALISFGSETDTQDASGLVIKETKLPGLDVEEFEKILQNFIGEIEQIPPMFSAIKVNGQPLYKLARQGIEIKREPRKIEIHDLKLISYNKKQALIDVTCSKGTYIRTLCQDIGRATNSSAYMSFLIRVQSGIFHIKDSYTLEEIKELEQHVYLTKMVDSLANWPSLEFMDEDIRKLSHGNSIILTEYPKYLGISNARYKVLNQKNELLAIGSIQDNYFKPERVFK